VALSMAALMVDSSSMHRY